VYIVALYIAILGMSILGLVGLLPGVRSVCVVFPFLELAVDLSPLLLSSRGAVIDPYLLRLTLGSHRPYMATRNAHLQIPSLKRC
jgi:hypothetical protein